MVKKLPTSIFCVAALLFTLNTVFSQNEKNSNTSPDDSSKITKTSVFQYIENNFKIGGWIDAQYQFDNNWTENQSSVFQIRRARLDFKGSLSKWVDFRLQADFAPTPRLIDAFIKVNFCKYAKLQVGQFKIPFSLENILSPLDLELMENAQVISALSGYKDVTGISSYANGREIGAMLTGTLVETTVRDEKIPILRYGVGVFGGNGINVKTDNLAKDISARIEFCPFVKHLTLSVSGYWGKYNMLYNNNLTNIDGKRIRYAGGLQYADGNWVLRSEYLWGNTEFAMLDETQDTYTPIPLHTHGFYLTAGYWFKFGWGANSTVRQKLRPVLRFDYYEKDLAANTPSMYYSTGVEWWPEKHLRVQIAYTLKQRQQEPQIGHNITAMISAVF